MKALHTHSKTTPGNALKLPEGILQETVGSEAPPILHSFKAADVLNATVTIIAKGIHGTFYSQAQILAFERNNFHSQGVNHPFL